MSVPQPGVTSSQNWALQQAPSWSCTAWAMAALLAALARAGRRRDRADGRPRL